MSILKGQKRNASFAQVSQVWGYAATQEHGLGRVGVEGGTLPLKLLRTEEPDQQAVYVCEHVCLCAQCLF